MAPIWMLFQASHCVMEPIEVETSRAHRALKGTLVIFFGTRNVSECLGDPKKKLPSGDVKIAIENGH